MSAINIIPEWMEKFFEQFKPTDEEAERIVSLYNDDVKKLGDFTKSYFYIQYFTPKMTNICYRKENNTDEENAIFAIAEKYDIDIDSYSVQYPKTNKIKHGLNLTTKNELLQSGLSENNLPIRFFQL